MGHWKDYQELEESLSIDELIVTLNALHARERREQQFQAAIQGIELEGAKVKPDENFENVWNRAKNEVRGEKTETERFKKLGIAMVNEYGG